MFKQAIFVAAALLVSIPFVPQAKAQTASNQAAVTMTFNVNSSLTVAATPATLAFTQTDARDATAAGPISVVTSWNLTAGGVTVFTDAYFSSIPAALTDGTLNIPTSDIFASINGGTAAACTLTDANVPAALAGATCPQVFTAAAVAAVGTHTDTILFSLVSPTDFQASTAGYAGTLTISAQTT